MADDNVGATEETGGSPVSLIDSENTPTIYANGIYGMSLRDGVLLLNLTRSIYGIPKSKMDGNHIEAAARLLIPLPAYLKFVKYMVNSLTHLLERGVIDEETKASILEEKKDDA